jgi:hypothetical protein
MVLIYVAGLALAGLYFRNALNTDAVAYLRLAEYYSQAKWNLAISGYWGPMASWIMALLLKFGCSPLAAGRVFMGLSAVVFFAGCLAVYRSFQLPDGWVDTGVALAVLVGVYWSVRFITPDLLLGGLIGLATSRQLAESGFRTIPASAGAGLLWGVAYLTKAIAFPVAILATVIIAALLLRNHSLERRLLLRNVVVTLLAFGLVAGPWAFVLSFKYHSLTFSTAPKISHALTGPPDVDRYHPFARAFHPPAPGRVTDWEEPSLMAYRYWSPFESPAYARHQIKVLGENVFLCLVVLASVNLAGPVLLLFWIFRRVRSGSRLTLEKWEWALIVPVLLFVLYLPCQVVLAEQRFFYAAFPFLFAASVCWVAQKRGPQNPLPVVIPERTAWWCIVPGIVLPLAVTVFVLGNSPKLAGDCAVDLAGRMERAHLAAPMAGSGMIPGGRTGLYLAFLVNQPWYGDELQPSAASFKASGARLAVVTRGSELDAALNKDSAFANLDPQLFASPGEAGRCRVKLYQLNP